MSAFRKTVHVMVAALAVGTVGVTTAAPAHAVNLNSDVVLSEVYGGGGNTGALFTNDFIELYNKGAAPVDITGWSVQYTSTAGATWTNKTPLTGSVPPGGFYLIQEAAGTTVTNIPLPTAPDATGTINMSGTAGKVALVDNNTALTCGADCDGAAGVVDFLGFGSATNDFAGAPTGNLGNTVSAQRKLSPFANTGNNFADFTVAGPTPDAPPGAVATGPDCTLTPLPIECVPGTTTIQDVQGDGFISPLKGTAVSKVAGVVTAIRSAGSSRGFWIQQPTPDAARPSASSGVFVFTSSSSVAVGDSVLVSGTVNDFYPLASGETLATTSSLSITELNPTTTTIVSHANQVPQPLQLTPTTVPAVFAPTVAGGNIEAITPVDPSRSVQEFFEAHEGMLVEADNARVVGPGNTFGEIYVTTKPTDQATPRGGNYIAGYDAVPTGRLLVTPVSGTVPPANVGDVLSGVTSGPVDWSTFGGYDIAATSVGARVDNGLTGTTASPQAADQLAVATYNVENLAPSDPQAKYDRLGAGVVTNLKSPDIISVEEVQDNSGATDDGVVAADQTLTKLIAAIAAAGGPTYLSASIDPVNDADGGQPGGNIRVVFLYNPARVTFVAKPGGDSTTAVSVSAGTDGTAELSFSPGRVDPTNTAWTSSRKPLAGEFTFDGRKVIVVANHFNSKGGDQSSEGRFQPPTRSSEVQRTQQATVLNGFVKQVLAADPNAAIVLAGDFNDYQFSGPITTLTDNGATLTDLINTLPVNERYTYNFNGISQVLDHIFVSKSLTDVQYDVVHVNSEFSDQASDHDPQVVRVRQAPPAPPTVTVAPNFTVAEGSSIQIAATATGTGTLHYAWTPAASFDDPTSASPTFTGVDDGPVAVTVTVTDDHGSATATTTVLVTNVAPTVALTAPSSATQGQPIGITGSFTDPGLADTHTAVVAWGDGSTSPATIVGNAVDATTHTYAAAGTFTITLTVTDDDGGAGSATAAVAVGSSAIVVTVGDAQAVEGSGLGSAGTLVFTVRLSAADPANAHTVTYKTVNGTATKASDYVDKAGSLTFKKGETEKTVLVRTQVDRIDEPDETFTLQVSLAGSGLDPSAPHDLSGTGTIIDDDQAAISTLNTTVFEGNSGTTDVQILVVMSPSSVPVVVNYTTVAGTAHAGSDYVATTGSVTFSPGQIAKIVTVKIVNDRVRETTEQFGVAFSSSGAAGTPVSTVTIRDND